MSKSGAEPVEEGDYLSVEYMSRLRALAEVLESGDASNINKLVGELTTLRESALYQELGKLTREIHDSIQAFGNDDRLAELATETIPDAKERLSFIVTKTYEAAHKTMEGAEQTITLAGDLSSKASGLHDRWQQFQRRELSKEDFITLNDDIDKFLASVDGESNQINGRMTDIMLAQDYQDITGQMIKQVVSMVQEIEEKLVRLVTLSGASCQIDESQQRSADKPVGPQLPTADAANVVSSQGDVDDLLASLGF
ncbi:MAG: protein phosphatase CheZ [Gammaproteobacteria bacterium]|nr:protein phosphatase CheZ [Gammaproteobacteria bacterium]